jgi:hypothetical protein
LTADYQPTPDSTVIIGCSNLIAENGRQTSIQTCALLESSRRAHFSRAEIAGLAAERLIRGTHIERAIDDHVNGTSLRSLIATTAPSRSSRGLRNAKFRP